MEVIDENVTQNQKSIKDVAKGYRNDVSNGTCTTTLVCGYVVYLKLIRCICQLYLNFKKKGVKTGWLPAML